MIVLAMAIFGVALGGVYLWWEAPRRKVRREINRETKKLAAEYAAFMDIVRRATQAARDDEENNRG